MSGTSQVKVYIPRDTTAKSLGADKVAIALQHQVADVNIVRNGSRGMFWLEPMIEVETPQGRVAYGPVQTQDIESLLASHFLQGDKSHALCLGLTEQIPYFAKQQRVTFARVGLTDPTSIEDYRANGGLKGLENALDLTPQNIVDDIKTSGLRGRGGAAFPTGIKWQTVLNTPSDKKYIVCNADEGDSGTFADRMLMEGDPLCLVEGIIIAGLAVGADQGYLYLREEYPVAHEILNEAIANAKQANILGDNILGSGKTFKLEVRLGAGAYICGEETALLESLEGKRGMVRAKPPLPAMVGLFGKPTIVNNVISLASVPDIMANGPDQYQAFGTGHSRGTLPFQLAGNIKYGGLVELAFGPSLRTLLEDFGGGTRTGKPMRALQVGGPLGAYLPEKLWDTPLDYEAFMAIGAGVGHGGIVAFDDSVNLSEQARFSMEFCTIESCGKCTPCRIGATRGVEVIDRITHNEQRKENIELLEELCDTMVHGSLCAMGGMTPIPVISALNHFPEDFSPTATQQGDNHA
jgi:formate dehydrogenase iron-sulfur subunit